MTKNQEKLMEGRGRPQTEPQSTSLFRSHPSQHVLRTKSQEPRNCQNLLQPTLRRPKLSQTTTPREQSCQNIWPCTPESSSTQHLGKAALTKGSTIWFLISKPWAICKGKFKPIKRQSTLSLPALQPSRILQVGQVFVVCPDYKRLFSSLQPVPHFVCSISCIQLEKPLLASYINH